MANPVPDRGNHPKRRVYGKTFEDLSGYRDAHSKAATFEHTWMKDHPDWKIHAWKTHPEGVTDSRELFMGKYDRAIPDTQNGKRGVTLFRGPWAEFHPNESISGLDQIPQK